MADLTITASQVIPGTDAQYAYGKWGATVTAGQDVYYDSTADSWKLFDADNASINTNTPGIALNGGSSGQAAIIQTGGTVTIGAGASPVLSTIYIASATAGGICPASDLASLMKTVILGVGGATNTIILKPWNSGSTKA